MQIRNHYFFAFFLLLFFPAFTAAQIRLAPSRNRSSIFSRTTTKSPNGLSPKPPVTKEIEKPSLTLPARTGQFFVYAFSYKDFDKPSIENRTNAVRDRFGFGARPSKNQKDVTVVGFEPTFCSSDRSSWSQVRLYRSHTWSTRFAILAESGRDSV